MKSERIAVEGMSCQHCVSRVETALSQLDGVEVETVEIGEVRISRDPERIGREAVTETIREAGYAVA